MIMKLKRIKYLRIIINLIIMYLIKIHSIKFKIFIFNILDLMIIQLIKEIGFILNLNLFLLINILNNIRNYIKLIICFMFNYNLK